MASIALGRAARSTRGKRLTAAAEDSGDEEFWNQQFFAEESEDDSFGGSDAEVEEDEFDADFFESETSSDEEEAEESRRDDDDDRKRKRGYVEPNKKKAAAKRVKVVQSEDDSEEQDEGDSQNEDEDAMESEAPKPKVRAPKRAPLFDITVYEKRPQRAIAAENEKERLRRLAEAEATRKPTAPRTKVEYREPTQAERLAEAVETEKLNAESLKQLLTLEEEAKYKKERVVVINPDNAVPMIRYFSSLRRASPLEEVEAPPTSTTTSSSTSTTKSKSKGASSSSSTPTNSKAIFHRIGFFHPYQAEDDTLPECLADAHAPKPTTRAVCVITNQPAKYFDPLTQCPYATVDAFKQLRARYAQLVSQHALAQAKKQLKSESNTRRA